MTDANTKARLEHWVRPEIRALSAYHVPDASRYIKLDAMESPYRWPTEQVAQWQAILADVEINRYPDPSASELKLALRQTMSIPAGAEIILGNGSDEIIQMLMLAMCGENRTVLSVEPGFVMYHMVSTFTGMHYVGVPLNADFSLNRQAVLDAISQQQPAIIFIAYPNNPTGNLFDRAVVEEIIAAAPGIIIIDEAYHAFASDSFMPALDSHENLFVMRTVSKMGLAGLRLGLLAGNPQWLAEFDKVRLPYNINSLTQASALFALRNQAMLDQQTRAICQARGELYSALQQLDGLSVYPSQANFILFRTQAGQGTSIFEKLKTEGVLIKNLSPAGDALQDCLRVTVSTPEENAAFIQALDQIV